MSITNKWYEDPTKADGLYEAAESAYELLSNAIMDIKKIQDDAESRGMLIKNIKRGIEDWLDESDCPEKIDENTITNIIDDLYEEDELAHAQILLRLAVRLDTKESKESLSQLAHNILDDVRSYER